MSPGIPPPLRAQPDWLVTPSKATAKVVARGNEIVMENGLLRRVWRTAPNAACVALDNLSTGQSMLRAVKPEATVEINGKRYDIGGLKGQPDLAYLLPTWLDSMTADPAAFQFAGYSIGKPVKRFEWKRVRHSENLDWPPKGTALALEFRPPAAAGLDGVKVFVHYELYEGIPAMAKWISVENGAGREIELNRFENEILDLAEYEASVEDDAHLKKPLIHLQSDYSFGGGTEAGADQTTFWEPEPQFTSQINYTLTNPVTLKSKPPVGPDQLLKPGERFEAFRTFELLLDTDERERRGLALRRFQRTIAPWATENPILMHLRYDDSKSIRHAVDQCAAVGFEMIILTFGSGFQPESTDPAYLARLKADVDYAHSKGIEIGGYTLTASRDAGKENNVVADLPNPKTGRKGATFGQSPCLASAWSDGYYARMKHVIETTGIDVIEDDGSYPGDICASTSHAHHRGLNDSQWNQWKTITGFYQWMRARGGYINAPDYYYLSGSNKSAMGYREVNWSLPRDRQIILGRQNIFDGTWEKAPSMGWMFVPLVEYQGGGAAATLEPLSEHLQAYEAHLAQNFGCGVQACYRGPRLYDTDATKAVVKTWVDFYKKHRAILDSDLIHLRRADGRDLDYILHANPSLKECGLLMVWNPLDVDVKKTLRVPLYYTGLTDRASVSEKDGSPRSVPLDRGYEIDLSVSVPAHGITWFVFEGQ